MNRSPSLTRQSHRGSVLNSLLNLAAVAGLGGAGLLLAWKAGCGEQEWTRAVAEMKAAGYSTSLPEIAAEPVAEAGNLGAAELLRMPPGAGDNPSAEFEERRAILRNLGLRGRNPASGGPEAPMPAPGEPQDWKAWRSWLTDTLKWDVPADEQNDAKAVLAALRQRGTPVIPALIAAAQNSRSCQLVPAQRLRLELSGREDFHGLRWLVTMMHAGEHSLLAMEAAIASGDNAAATPYLEFAFRLDDLCASEAGLAPAMITTGWRNQIREAVCRSISGGRMNPDLLKHCQDHFVSRPFHPVLLKALEMETALSSQNLTDPGKAIIKSAWSRFLCRFLAKGAGASLCHRFLEDARLLKAADWAGLLRAHRDRAKENEHTASLKGFAFLLHADRAFAGAGDLASFHVAIPNARREMERRGVVIACAVARHRAATGRLPQSLTEIAGAIPAGMMDDLDGRPIRYRSLPDGWILWSVGADFHDDWHGEPPPRSSLQPAPASPVPEADWQWRFKAG